MTNEEIRAAAAAEAAAHDAAQTWVLTESAEFFFPYYANLLLQRVDVMREWRMAPIICKDGQDVPDMARSFWCYPEDVEPFEQWRDRQPSKPTGERWSIGEINTKLDTLSRQWGV